MYLFDMFIGYTMNNNPPNILTPNCSWRCFNR